MDLEIGGGEGWVNLDYPSEAYKQAQSNHSFIPYDIRNDSLPFADNEVDMAYCSHVIEHIEDVYIRKLFDECYRCIKPGGILRITCPDAEFLYNMSKLGKEYWKWIEYWYKARNLDFNKVRPVDCLVGEIATPRLLGYGYMQMTDDYVSRFDSMSMVDFFEYITEGLSFNESYVNNHINWWTIDKVASFLEEAGFERVIESRYGASYSYDMQERHKFDITHPEMSLYIEAIKL